MTKDDLRFKATIVVFSPHGNTRKVAETMGEGLGERGVPSDLIDLTGLSWDEIARFDYSLLGDFDLLMIAFPVYNWTVVEPMNVFLSNLPAVNGKYAGILVTYGGVTSGTALLDAARWLQGKGFTLLGAAKIVASHSNVFDERKDPYSHHPTEEDLRQVDTLAQTIVEKLNCHDPDPIALDVLQPQFALIRAISKLPLPKRKIQRLPAGVIFDPETIRARCIQCGKCVQACPLRIITLNPYPRRSGECIKCHNCARVCPTYTLVPEKTWRKTLFHFGLLRLHESPAIGGEKPMTQVFV